MKPDYRIQRSMLILPVNVPRFVQKAHQRGADAIVLDVEDAVPPSEKVEARQLLKGAVSQAGSGGADVFIRINNDPELLSDDLGAAVVPGVHGIFLPKVESPQDVTHVEAMISRLEAKRRIGDGQIKLSLHIESPRALLRIQEIASAGSRLESMSLGVDDYCLQLGVEPSEDGEELFLPMSMIVLVCKAFGIHPIGIQGSVAEFHDLGKFEKAAERSRAIGFTGAYCIHPDQVKILNRVFSPSPEKVEDAKRVIKSFEEQLKSGAAAMNLDDRMVDTPIYKQAKKCLELADAIEHTKRRKEEALRKLVEFDH